MANRNLETRDATKRKTSWKPASLLPTPDPQDGVTFRWIRVGSRGQSDTQNVSKRFREGWVPVNAKDHPELKVMSDHESRFTDGVEIGQLLLCRNDTENVKQRQAYYEGLAQQQINALDNDYMRENDHRMPKLKPERRTRATFGESE
jgi:hypothetical protein